jgi:hypothetical protein
MMIIPEDAAPFGSVDVADLSVLERARLACHTAKLLNPDDDTPPTEEDKALAREAFETVTTIKNKSHVNIGALANYPNASLRHLDAMLSEYDHELINSAMRIREFTKNRLLLEADNPDGKIRIRALELLGKIKDVGLFTDRIEITHKAKTDEELATELYNKLEKFMGTAQVISDVEPITEALQLSVEPEVQKERQLYGLLNQLEA